MKLKIQDKNKISIFEAIFQLLKTASSCVQFVFLEDGLKIEGMDKSHVCLFKIKMGAEWFSEYNFETAQTINVDTSIFHTILSHVNSDILVLKYDEENNDILNIELLTQDSNEDTNKKEKEKDKDKSKKTFDRYFSIPLIDADFESINIPEMEYDAEFKLECKKIHDLTSQMILFGNTLNIICSEEGIDLKTTGDSGTMKVNLPIDELSEFSISEGESLDIGFSLHYIHKMCLTTKLGKEVQFSISANFPICIDYDLGENSSVVFYVAPKM